MTMPAIFAHDAGNLSMPAATVLPVLQYADAPAACAWLCKAFQFRERLRIGGHRMQLAVGQGAVVIAQSADPLSVVDNRGHALMVRVVDVDAHYAWAVKAGAKILDAPTSFPYGERQYSAIDVGGHVWTFSQSEADVDPAQWGGELFGRDADK